MSAFFERLTGLTLLDPAYGLLVLLVPGALWVAGRQRPSAVSFAPLPPLHTLPPSWRVRLLWVPRVLCVLGLLLVVLALTRPAVRSSVPVASEGVDILLCLDTSSSMATDDMDPRKRGGPVAPGRVRRTRLAVAQAAATRFIAGRPNDRVGLLTFARYPDVRCPLTLDHEALVQILADVVPVAGEGPENATGIGAAVARAAQVLDTSGARQPVVILLTDGEENVALVGRSDEISPQHAAQLCVRLGVRVHAVAVGAAQAVAGVERPLDTQAIEALAKRTGGAFQRAGDAGAMDAVYTRIDQLEKTQIEQPQTVFLDRYRGVLLLGVVLLVLGGLLGSSVLGVLP